MPKRKCGYSWTIPRPFGGPGIRHDCAEAPPGTHPGHPAIHVCVCGATTPVR